MMTFFFQAEAGIRDGHVTGVQTCALPISAAAAGGATMDPAVPVPGLRAAASAPWGGRGHHDIGGGAEHRVSSSEGVAAPLVRGVLAAVVSLGTALARSEEHTSELQSRGQL